ncbi:MAG: hypothetical protein IKH75_00925 [Ruminococcus sp.]|nr:hypothetical protein [Ruminococcus sp.]
MDYLGCIVLGFKGFLIVFGFCLTAMVAVAILALIGSMFGLGKNNKRRDL